MALTHEDIFKAYEIYRTTPQVLAWEIDKTYQPSYDRLL